MDVDPNDRARFLQREWEHLAENYSKIETNHSQYLQLLNQLHKVQVQELGGLQKFRKDLSAFEEKVRKDSKSLPTSNNEMNLLLNEIKERKSKLVEMAGQLPKTDNGLYLNIILGNINVSLTNNLDKFRYKDDYEKFKMTVTFICMITATVALCFHFRFWDALFHFLLVWYYCTLTIRESILRCNGSRIKGWWVAHHYFSAILCSILLTWPDGECYRSFRVQFLLFSIYLTVVQIIQCQYQRGCLYRLRSLGDSHSMAITIDGFHMWMFRGLTFVLPFLMIGYLTQLYNAYTLYYIWCQGQCTKQWQVLAASLLFLFLSVGNTVTTATVCYRKWAESKRRSEQDQQLRNKYSVDITAEAEEATQLDTSTEGDKLKHT